MRLPIATDRKHPVYIVDMGIPKIYDKQIEVSNETVDIEGPLCMTEDNDIQKKIILTTNYNIE